MLQVHGERLVRLCHPPARPLERVLVPVGREPLVQLGHRGCEVRKEKVFGERAKCEILVV